MRTPRKNHEPAYQQIAAQGGRGWDDLRPHEGDLGSYAALDAFLATIAEVPEGATALEVGCGGGQASLRLAAKGFRVCGVDEAPTAIALARANAAEAGFSEERVRFVVGDACALERCLGGERFDLVVDNHALHCVVYDDERAGFLRGVYAALRAGGVFFSETMSREDGFDPTVCDADPVTAIARSGTRVWVSEARLAEEFLAAGFAHVERHRRANSVPAAGALLVSIARRSA